MLDFVANACILHTRDVGSQESERDRECGCVCTSGEREREIGCLNYSGVFYCCFDDRGNVKVVYNIQFLFKALLLQLPLLILLYLVLPNKRPNKVRTLKRKCDENNWRLRETAKSNNFLGMTKI